MADIRKVLIRRLHAFDDSKSIKQWRRCFLDNGLPFPSLLIPPISNPKLENREEEEPAVLRYWFQHETWAYGEAILLLAGVDPRSASINAETNVFGQPIAMVKSVRTLDGIDLQHDVVIPGEPDYERFVIIQETLKSLFAIWHSGDHPKRNAPTYYLNWASSKGFEISWAPWAAENDLISKSANHELMEVERLTLLKIVVGMAIDKYGYNPEGTRQEATGEGPNSIYASLSRYGLSVSADSIRKYLNEARLDVVSTSRK